MNGLLNDFWFEMLNKRHGEIENESFDDVCIDKYVNVYERLIYFANIAQKEGLLSLEEAGKNLDKSDMFQDFFALLVYLIVDGSAPHDVYMIGLNRILSMNLRGKEGLISMMYLHGSLMIQAGYNTNIFNTVIRSYMPLSVTREITRRESEASLLRGKKETQSINELIKNLSETAEEVDEKDHSLVAETAKTIMLLSDKDMQRLLRDLDNGYVSLAMKGLSGKAKAKILNNMSPRLATMIISDMEYMGPVRMSDVEDACNYIMKKLVRLEAFGEINPYDLSLIKIVLDMWEHTEKKNKELKDKYQELRNIINDIYLK